MSQLKTKCPHCQTALLFAATFADKTVRCPSCRGRFQINVVRVPSDATLRDAATVDDVIDSGDDSQPSDAPERPASAGRGEVARQGVASTRSPHAGKGADAKPFAPRSMPDTPASRQVSAESKPDPTKGGDRVDRDRNRQRAESETPAVAPDASANEPRPTAPHEGESRKRIGRFEMMDVLGEGSFGTVYRAYDPLLDRDTALKVLRPSVSSKVSLDRILAEAKASASLRHPNIVGVYEVGTKSDAAYIASQYVPGENLSRKLKSRAAPATGDRSEWVLFLHMLIELCRGLAYAHRQGIVHRDVKPHNVLIDENGHAQLTDFGLARRTDGSSDERKQLIGTPAYMSPEQASEDQSQVGPPADQYAVGVILYETLTGRKPFEGDAYAVLSSIAHDEIPSPSSIGSGIPKPLELICLKALSRDPADRYADCDALADDLQRWIDGDLVEASNPTWLDRSVHWARRHPQYAGWVAAALLAVIGGGGAVLTLAVGKAMAASLTVRDQRTRIDDFEVNLSSARSELSQTESLATEAEHRAGVAQYARNLDLVTVAIEANEVAKAHRLLDRVPWSRRGVEHGLLRRRAMGTPYILHAGQRPLGISWSHDGSLFVAAGPDGLRFWDGERFVPLGDFHVEGVTKAVFHPHKMELLTLHQSTPRSPEEAPPAPVVQSEDAPQATSGESSKPELRVWAVRRVANDLELTLLRQARTEFKRLKKVAFHPSGHTFAVSGDPQRRQPGVEIRSWSDPQVKVLSRPSRVPGHVSDLAFTADGTELHCQSSRAEHGCTIHSVSTENRAGSELEAYVKHHHAHAREQELLPVQPPNLASVFQKDKTWAVRPFPRDRFGLPEYYQGKILCWDREAIGHGTSPSGVFELGSRQYVRLFSDGRLVDGKTERVGHMAAVTQFAIRPDRRCYATADQEGHIRVWPIHRRIPEGIEKPLKLVSGSRMEVDATGKVATASIPDGEATILTLWDVRTGRTLSELPGHERGIPAVAFHPAQNRLASVDGRGTVRLWDLEDTSVISELALDADVRDLRFDRSGDHLVLAGIRRGGAGSEAAPGNDATAGFAAVYKADLTAAPVVSIDQPAEVLQAAFVHGRNELVTGSLDGVLNRWSVATGKRVESYETDGLVPIDLDVSESQLAVVLAEACATGTGVDGAQYRSKIRCWRVSDSSHLYDVEDPSHLFRYLRFDPSGNRIIAPTSHGFLLYDAVTGAKLIDDRRFPCRSGFNEHIVRSVPVTKTRLEDENASRDRQKKRYANLLDC